jgi:phage baseplate assembly protein W
MSYDRRIDQLCPHLVVDEFFLLTAARDQVTPLRPISSSNSVRVRLNGLQDVPSYGVTVPATTSGTREGPYTITKGVNDTLRVSVSSGPWQVVVVPASTLITSDRLVAYLSTRLSGITPVVEGNRIRLRTTASGSSATFYLHATSTLAAYLGITSNRIYQGKDVFPGWTLVTASHQLGDRPIRLIVFDDYLSAATNTVEISYTTVRPECRRCGGLGIENDWRILSSGEVDSVRDVELLRQEFNKYLYTTQGSNVFHGLYGTSIINMISQKLTASGFIQNKIMSEVMTAFSRWQRLKTRQREVGQDVSEGEFPFRLDNLTIEPGPDDPTVLYVSFDLTSESSDPIQLTRGLKLSYDVMSQTQQQTLFQQISSPTTSV